MNFSNVINWVIPEGNVMKVTDSQNRVIWQKIDPRYTVPFYVENITNTNEILSISKNSDNAPTLTIEYSMDNSTWQTLGTTSTTALTRTVTPGEKVYLRCNTGAWGASSNYNRIRGVSKVGGNAMSLLYGSNFTGREISFPPGNTSKFHSLFNDNTILADASKLLLPATEAEISCYHGMFQGCTSLTSAPALPATTLSSLCYFNMFNGCTSLTTAPTLPATTLVNQCYYNMFRGCTSLTSAPTLPATTLANGCYYNMFYGCTSLTSAPILPATTLASSCYSNMFRGCTSLTTAPELLAPTLVSSCYASMFRNCTNLNYVKCLAIDISASGCTTSWMYQVSSTGTFVKDPSMTAWTTGASGIPSGWTVADA